MSVTLGGVALRRFQSARPLFSPAKMPIIELKMRSWAVCTTETPERLTKPLGCRVWPGLPPRSLTAMLPTFSAPNPAPLPSDIPNMGEVIYDEKDQYPDDVSGMCTVLFSVENSPELLFCLQPPEDQLPHSSDEPVEAEYDEDDDEMQIWCNNDALISQMIEACVHNFDAVGDDSKVSLDAAEVSRNSIMQGTQDGHKR